MALPQDDPAYRLLTEKTAASKYVPISDVGGIYLRQDTAATTYAPKTHTHAAADVTSGTFAPARLPAATTTAAGSMSAADKTKLDGATSSSTGVSQIVMRNSSGTTGFAYAILDNDPTASTHSVRKGYADATYLSKADAPKQYATVVTPEQFAPASPTTWSSYIQQALDAIKAAGGGTLRLQPREYYVPDAMVLCDNLTIEGNGATLIKKSTSDSSYSAFVSRSFGAVGYGSGAKNVTVRGITFRGTFSQTGGRAVCGFALNHAQDVLIEDCNFIEAQANGHSLDLNGCDNITIRDCVWRGFLATSSTGVSEAIQIDQSKNGSASYSDTAGSWDGLTTKNLTVDSNKFLPLTVGDVTYPAPNPMGNHTVREGQYYENIAFTNNLIVDPYEDTTSSSSNSQYRGTVHLIGVRNARIEGNRWVATTPRSVRCVSLYGVEIGNPVTQDPQQPNSVAPIPPQSPQNVAIRNNTFVGFSGIATANTPIFAYGLAGAYIEGLTIEGNVFRDNGNTVDAAFNMDIGYVRDFSIVGNKTKTSRRFLNIANSEIGTIARNQIRDSNTNPIYMEVCSGVTISGNQQDDYGLNWSIRNSSGITITDNTFRNPKAVNTGSAAQAIQITNTVRFSVTDNILYSPTVIQRGIVTSGTSETGQVKDNIIVGYTLPTQDSTSPVATKITYSGNIS